MTNKKNDGLPRPAPRMVRIDRVLTDEDTFQPRGGGLNEAHVAALQDVLRQGGQLDPLCLWEDPATGALTVADGHHRLEAYLRHGKAKNIPASIYRCDRRTALLIPIQDNAKARLPLQYNDRANWAWKLTVEGAQSKATVVASCGVSDGTVAHMRRVWRELQAKGEDAPKTWWEAQKLNKSEEDREWSDQERDEWRQGLVQKAHRSFGAELADLMKRSPEAAAELLDLCGGRQLESVMDHLGYVLADEESEEGDCPF
ncbi:ParB/RepB/Spo0J family partition protein [Fuscovulum ytuae]|uniref:ParB N-terminal domain-containing protein n=1 Tax=Fuscovulum ytuae TaxID=3042299 RepID=A0ABY8Q7I4_9RHOB|nr:ParB N-terminal domain-containing protein [Fuscovulum sp. YMD61]WGV16779.1 ParB N-terminal domain-containing protein [Fuscovulum sp. YMD61]